MALEVRLSEFCDIIKRVEEASPQDDRTADTSMGLNVGPGVWGGGRDSRQPRLSPAKR